MSGSANIPEDAAQLHRDLKSFYNRDTAYFLQADESNRELTPERAHAFQWIAEGDAVLDVGCGSCQNGRHLRSRCRYFGCDISGVALGLGKNLLGEAARLLQAEGHLLPFVDRSFDVVLTTYALEHFVFVRQTLDEIWRVCRDAGRVILISPAYDDPRLLPPSTGHWSRSQRGTLILRQAIRQVSRHFRPRRFYFAQVQQPRVLKEPYQSDFDAVHLVSAREIANYFLGKGAVVLFERKRSPRNLPAEQTSWRHRLREQLRNRLLKLHVGEYAGLNLQLVVKKPELAVSAATKRGYASAS